MTKISSATGSIILISGVTIATYFTGSQSLLYFFVIMIGVSLILGTMGPRFLRQGKKSVFILTLSILPFSIWIIQSIAVYQGNIGLFSGFRALAIGLVLFSASCIALN